MFYWNNETTLFLGKCLGECVIFQMLLIVDSCLAYIMHNLYKMFWREKCMFWWQKCHINVLCMGKEYKKGKLACMYNWLMYFLRN